jgi:hypothetical protein
MRSVAPDELRAIAEQIVVEHRGKRKKATQESVLIAGRSKLEKEPTLRAPYQIDKIMREVQARLSDSS